MANAGYGNHDAPPPGRRDPKVTPEARTHNGRGDADPDRRAGNPAVSPEARREISTPGDGAGPMAVQGDEVDPGAG